MNSLHKSSLAATILVIMTLLASSLALADVAQFSQAEIAEQRAKIDVITATAAKCLKDTYADHLGFYKKWGISKYYGNRKPEHKTEKGRRSQLRKYGKPEELESQLEPISCIGLTVQCLGEGFKEAGMNETWEKIVAALAVENNFYGTDLQIMLHDLGWTTVYWNPDPSKNAAWDIEDRTLNPLKDGKKWMPVWGGHASHFNSVMKRGTYMGIPVDERHMLVDFKTTPPRAFKSAPFFVGVAHAGYHVFPGSYGQVIEAHSMRTLNSIDNLQVSEFNPLAPNGGPRWTNSEHYRSGLMVLPPQ